MVNIDLIKKLIQLVKDENISGLAIEEGGTKYEIRKEFGGTVPVQKEIVHSPSAAPEKAATAIKDEKSDEDEGLVAITSPMVGTFYSSPSPDSPQFIGAGDHVSPGKVVKVLVDNAKPVEYGQKLILVKKD